MRAHPDNSKMKVKNFFHALRRMICATRLYAAAFTSITPYCKCTTSNLMATALYGHYLLCSTYSNPVQNDLLNAATCI